MTISVPDTRQYPLVAYAEFTFADLVSGVASKLVELPLGAVVTGGYYIIDTAFDSGTSDAITIGDADDVDEYHADADAQAAVVSALTVTGIEVTADNTAVNIILTSVGTAATAGAGRLILEYVVPTRSNENFE